MKSEYKYPGGTQYLDPWEKPEPRIKKYDRSLVKKELITQIIEFYNHKPFDDEDQYTMMDGWINNDG